MIEKYKIHENFRKKHHFLSLHLGNDFSSLRKVEKCMRKRKISSSSSHRSTKWSSSRILEKREIFAWNGIFFLAPDSRETFFSSPSLIMLCTKVTQCCCCCCYFFLRFRINIFDFYSYASHFAYRYLLEDEYIFFRVANFSHSPCYL